MVTGATAAHRLEWLPRRPSQWDRIGRRAGAGGRTAPTTREMARRCTPLPTSSAAPKTETAAESTPDLPNRHLRAQVWGKESRPGHTGIWPSFRPHVPPPTASLWVYPVFFIEAGVTPTTGRPVRVTDIKTRRRSPGELLHQSSCSPL